MSDAPLIDALASAAAKPDMTPASDVLKLESAPQSPDDYKKQKAEELYGAFKKGDWKTLTQFFCG